MEIISLVVLSEGQGPLCFLPLLENTEANIILAAQLNIRHPESRWVWGTVFAEPPGKQIFAPTACCTGLS